MNQEMITEEILRALRALCEGRDGSSQRKSVKAKSRLLRMEKLGLIQYRTASPPGFQEGWYRTERGSELLRVSATIETTNENRREPE